MSMKQFRAGLEARPSALAAVAVVLLVGASAVVVLDGATPVTVDGAVDRFRADPDPLPTPSPSATTPAAPSPTPTVDEGGTSTGAAPMMGADGTTPTDPAATEAPAESPTEEPSPRPTASPAPVAPSPEPTSATSRRPAEGVYVYATQGHDEIDAFGQRRHDYPAETTTTVRHTDCGTHSRWDVLEERWDETTTCTTAPGERVVRAITSYHEFLGHGQRQDLDCAIPLPSSASEGDTWTGTCTSEDTDVELTLTAGPAETFGIGGHTVETVHVHIEAVFSGATEGRQTSDRWYTRDTGLDVRVDTTTDVTSEGPTGPVRYRERVTRLLTSPEPRR